MGLRPDRPAGFRDRVFSLSEVRYPRYRCKGRRGEADLAVSYFSKTAPAQTPQVLCEFKAIRSALSADQKRIALLAFFLKIERV